MGTGIGGGPSSQQQPNFAHLLDPKKKWYNNRRLITLNAWIVLLLITSSTNGYDGSMLNSLQSLDQWEAYFHTPTGSKLGLLSAIQNIGSLAAYPFAPYCSDGLGRRYTIWIGAAIMCAATAIQTASHSVGMFIGARFMIGFGLTFAASAAPMLVTELAYPPYRAPLTSAYNSLWNSGAIVAAWTTFGTAHMASDWSWRIPSALQALPSVIQVFLVVFCPESPRFLINKGKDAQALKILAYYHADGNEEDPLVQYEYEEIKAALALDRQVAERVGWKTLFSTPGNRKRLRIIIAIAFFSQWSGNGILSYYLNKVLLQINITSSTTQLLINGILSIWSLVCALSASTIVERLGRRPMFLISTAGMFVFFSLLTISTALFVEKGLTGAGHSVIAFIALYGAFYSLAYTPLIVTYCLEILPYSLRAKGFTVFNFTISLALIFNQYVNPVALLAITWKYYIVYIVWIVFEFLFLYKYLVETKGLSLEETAVLFDGEEAELAIQAAGEHSGRAEVEKEKSSGSMDKEDVTATA